MRLTICVILLLASLAVSRAYPTAEVAEIVAVKDDSALVAVPFIADPTQVDNVNDDLIRDKRHGGYGGYGSFSIFLVMIYKNGLFI